jgi:hypothetical protein
MSPKRARPRPRPGSGAVDRSNQRLIHARQPRNRRVQIDGDLFHDGPDPVAAFGECPNGHDDATHVIVNANGSVACCSNRNFQILWRLKEGIASLEGDSLFKFIAAKV